MQTEQLRKCAHEPCICQVAPEDEYCGDRCRENARTGRDTCTCDHVDCAVEPDLVVAPLASPA